MSSKWERSTRDYAKCALTDITYDAEYEYYANGWLKCVKNGSTELQSYTYDQAGVVTGVRYGNGTDATIGYDSDPRYGISSIAYSKGEDALATFGYTRDNSELPVSLTEATNFAWSFGYNNDSRLVTANPPAPVPDQPAGGSYVYDWIGNRLSPPADPNQMEYNKADQLLTWPGMYSYTYYADGSLHDARNASGTSVLRSYTYWPSGLLNTASYSGRSCESTWDAAGNRVGLEIGGGDYSFVYDRIAGIPAVLEEDGPGGVKVYYFRTPGGAIIASRAGGPDQNSVPDSWRYYHYDELGSTRVLTDGDGDVTDTYSYDPYGNLITHEGSTQQPYQWCGAAGYYTHYQDPEFCLIEMGYRFYDPEVGRFTQLDPIGDGLNWYEYCGGNPLGGIDPWGLKRCADVGGSDPLDSIQMGLDVIGLIPGLGEIADGANAVISLGRGDYVGAGLSLVSMIPVVGDAIGKGGKAVRRVSRLAEAADTVVYLGRREGRLVYGGITNNFIRREGEWAGKYAIEPVTDLLTRKEARAIETAIIEKSRRLGLNFDNRIRSISPKNPLYNELMPWANEWIDANIDLLR